MAKHIAQFNMKLKNIIETEARLLLVFVSFLFPSLVSFWFS